MRKCLGLQSVRSSMLFISALGVALALSNAAHAQCSSPLAGRWGPNLQAETAADPGFIDINFTSCGDTNTQPNTTFGVKVWVKQSSGKWFGRPRVAGAFISSRGKRWLLAKVWTGGYVDQMFMRADGGDLLVFIRHKSLDSKPDASVWYRYKKHS